MSRHPFFFYIGEIWEGGTCLDRMKAISDLGNRVVFFDTSPFINYKTKVFRSIAYRFNIGPPVNLLNREMKRFVKTIGNVSHIWIDNGRWIAPETLFYLKKETGAQIIHYTPDPIFLYHKSHLFKACIPLYDILFTTKKFELPLYKRANAQKVILTLPGYAKHRFYPRDTSKYEIDKYGADISLIGHYEKHYLRCLKYLSRSRANIKVWGPGWEKYGKYRRWAKSFIRGDGIWGDEYPIAICCAKMCLGLLSKIIPETVTTRSFEIPACSVFMLAERTEDHLQLFEEGIEAEYFKGEEELFDKAKYYLGHPTERNKIAAAGRERCIKSGYSYHDRIRMMLKEIGIIK